MAREKPTKIGECIRCTNKIYRRPSGEYIGHSTLCKNYLTGKLTY